MTGTLQIMAKSVSADKAEEILAKIEDVPNILTVNFDKNDDTYYKDGNALFVAVINGDDYSENAKQVISDVKDALAEYDGIEYGGTATEKQNLRNSITNEMFYILAVSLCFVTVILLITSESWLEPLVLLFDKPMKKARKKAFVPKGNTFCKVAVAAGRFIVPTALVIIVLCGFLQTKNTFIFSDTSSGNHEISDTFGNGNSVVVVYKNSADGLENERKLASCVSEYKTNDEKTVLTNHTSYSNTAAEPYDTDKAVNKLEISENDAELLFTDRRPRYA